MYLSDFYYHLPAELIAQQPLPGRRDSRLLVLDAGRAALSDKRLDDLSDLLSPGDLLVLNDSRVIPARLFGRKASGGRVEILVERLLDAGRALVHIRASKPPRDGGRIELPGGAAATVTGRRGDLYLVTFEAPQGVARLLGQIGRVPLPPYIRRDADEQDQARYQTVYARHPGSAAAPTAGLHFDEALLTLLRDKGVELGYVTLHVGAGTFQPVRAEHIPEHRMHPEVMEVTPALCDQVARARARGGRVVAVGTTSVRALESASRAGRIEPYRGETSMFIYPGYDFISVDAMITNFHLPESTLLMLVCAFAGTERIMEAYRHAIEGRYRFLSYGDAMFITPPRR
ncbi:MAG TPA: tRNA preQ1(34) S-adenosylmethionine ribosyltransferase-isomerase QueA [Gammaproteobacteria bacterium]|nr:tRNA preQ1(34) S-adenosylmethionine ribosyltransferase-isomerase QueA [Gammaproteobacteria bacterium]